MKLTKKRTKTILLSTLIPTALLTVTGVAVGGYYSSVNANPYKEYYRTPATDSVQSFLSSFYSSKLQGAKLLVLPGFTLNPPMTQALKTNQFNDMGFVLIDDSYGGESTSQVASIEYRVDEGSFITGIATAMYLNEYQDYFSKNDSKLTWATFGGLNFSSVTSFMAGFQKGINWFNEKVVKTYNAKPENIKKMKPIEQVFLGTTENDNYSGGFGPADGNSLIDKFLLKNVDCLIPVAGPQTISAVSKISAKLGQRTIVIGVDSAVENDNTIKTYKLPQDNNVASPTQILPFSSLKKIAETVPQIIDSINKTDVFPTTAPTSKIGGFGVKSLGDVDNDGVGVSTPGEEYFIKALKILDDSISDNKTALELLKQQVEFNEYFVANNGEKYQGIFKTGSGADGFTYELPTQATLYSTMPDKIPESLNSVDMNQNDWNKKKQFNLKGFIEKSNNEDKQKIKIILSTSSSILLDASFSQAAYLGLFYFYRMYDIKIPEIKG